MTKQVIIKTEQEVSVESPAILLDSHAKEVEALIADFNDAKALIKKLEEQKKAAEAQLRELMGSAQFGLLAGVERVKIATRNTRNIDSKLLMSAYPEAYEACLVESSYTVLTAVS